MITNCFVLEFSKGMILPKKDIESSSKAKLSKESLKNIHNSENVRLVKVKKKLINLVNKYLLHIFIGGKRR